ncbi:MAG: hypothetical protein JST93_04055 [Acidobacteria bacterium]|nr:hypothetical protein [Acidobacteriota bacterium]
MLSAIIVGENPALVNYVRQVCAEFGDICIHKSMEGAARRYEIAAALSSYEPDVAFVDVTDVGRAESLAAVCLQELLPRRLRTVLVPIGVEPDAEALARVAGEAVGPVLTLPFDADQLDRAVRAALRRRGAKQACQVLAVMPAKAGDGASTVAINLAGAAVRAYKRKTLYIEADLRSGAICHALRLQPRFPVGEVLLHAGSLMDGWGSAVVRFDGIDILPMGGSAAGLRGSRWDFYRLLQFARERYEVVVVDLPAGIDAVAEAVIAEADRAVMVSTPEATSVGLISRWLRDLEAGGTRFGHLRILVNRFTNGDMEAGEVASLVRREVSAVLPEDAKAVKAANRLNTLLQPGSRLLAEIVDVAGDLLQMPAPRRPFSVLALLEGILHRIAGNQSQARVGTSEIKL